MQKCLDTWLQQGIIHSSHSPYMSQVVIVYKKSGEIHLCIDFRALNAMTLHDSVHKELQVVKASGVIYFF